MSSDQVNSQMIQTDTFQNIVTPKNTIQNIYYNRQSPSCKYKLLNASKREWPIVNKTWRDLSSLTMKSPTESIHHKPLLKHRYGSLIKPPLNDIIYMPSIALKCNSVLFANNSKWKLKSLKYQITSFEKRDTPKNCIN